MAFHFQLSDVLQLGFGDGGAVRLALQAMVGGLLEGIAVRQQLRFGEAGTGKGQPAARRINDSGRPTGKRTMACPGRGRTSGQCSCRLQRQWCLQAGSREGQSAAGSGLRQHQSSLCIESTARTDGRERGLRRGKDQGVQVVLLQRAVDVVLRRRVDDVFAGDVAAGRGLRLIESGRTNQRAL
jgi:hypothetical protein